MAAADLVLVFATRNRGKISELELLLEGVRGIRIDSIAAFTVADVVEDQDTFAGNATKKALEVSRATGHPALADDSGLCVDALGGGPGVFSARYAGEGASDVDNNAKLLAALATVEAPDRGASFRSVLALADAGGTLGGSVLLAEGECRGTILAAPRGSGGFGYDPLFLVPDLGLTFAELGVGSKSDRSHRAAAMRLLRPKLLEYFGLSGALPNLPR